MFANKDEGLKSQPTFGVQSKFVAPEIKQEEKKEPELAP